MEERHEIQVFEDKQSLTYMGDMNVVLPEFLRKALGQGSRTVFSGGEGAGHDIASDAGSGAGEYQRAPLPIRRVDPVFFERQNGLTCEGKRRRYPRIQRELDVLGRNF